MRTVAETPTRGLQPHDATTRRRHANGPAPIGSVRDRDEARGDGCGRATTGAAAGNGRIPGIHRWPVQARLGGYAPAIFRSVAAADRHQPRGLHFPDYFRIVGANEVL